MRFIELTAGTTKVSVNADHIISVYADGTIRLSDGTGIVVRETREEIVALIGAKEAAPRKTAKATSSATEE
jgi:uncharacterized protein YlzI (FlbEa/FlbD family)